VTPREQSPALRLWRAELRSRRRSKTDFDPLWRAGCLESEAEEAEQDGLSGRAVLLHKLAAALIVAAAERKRGAVPA
jgi:hypothetical protein